MPYLGQTIRPLVKLGKDPDACWAWLGHSDGAGVAMKQIAGRNVPARRWLWEQLFGPIKAGYVIAQACGNVACINPFHLKKTTLASAQRLGANATLTAGDVTAIRAAREAYTRECREAGVRVRLTELSRTLGPQYGVSPGTIRDAWSGRTWRTKTLSPHARTPSANLLEEQAA